MKITKRPGTISLLKRNIAQCDKSIKAFTGSRHPTHKEMLIAAEARREAYQNVLDALRGNDMMLYCGADL